MSAVPEGYNDGTDYNTLIVGTIMANNTAREGGGAIFYAVDSGWGKLTLNQSHLHHNFSGQFQTFPGIYDNIDGHDGPPVMIHSTTIKHPPFGPLSQGQPQPFI